MDVHYHLNGTDFVWNERKAASNRHKHDGVTFEQAATVFFDPFFRVVDAGRNDEARDTIIGFDERAACCSWCISRSKTPRFASFRPAGLLHMKGKTMSIPDKLKTRLAKDRPMTSITLRIPVDVVESMKAIAPKRGLAGYQTLLKSYLSEGLRRDEEAFAFSAQAQLLEALRKHGVPQSVLDEATRDVNEHLGADGRFRLAA